jgi:hypothetical protein
MARALNDDWRERVLEAKHPPEEMAHVYSRLVPVYELWARLTESGPRRRVLELATRPAGHLLRHGWTTPLTSQTNSGNFLAPT